METTAQENCAEQLPRAERIATLNDWLRKTGCGGQLVVTHGVQSLAGFDAAELMSALSAYDQFDEYNDPHGERDFGALDLWGSELLWKIDYYDSALCFGSDNPADPAVTQRVLTILLAEEY